MKSEEIHAAVVSALHTIAPESDPAAIALDADVREELDIDSMDFLRYVTLLSQRFKVDIPESDYPKLFTIEGAQRYVQAVVAAAV